MNREEAKTTAGARAEHYRPLTLGTMAILEQLGNTVLMKVLGSAGGSIVTSFEELIVFLYVHALDTPLQSIRKQLSSKTLTEAAY